MATAHSSFIALMTDIWKKRQIGELQPMPEEALLDATDFHILISIPSLLIGKKEAEAGQSLEEFLQYLPFPLICSLPCLDWQLDVCTIEEDEQAPAIETN